MLRGVKGMGGLIPTPHPTPRAIKGAAKKRGTFAICPNKGEEIICGEGGKQGESLYSIYNSNQEKGGE